MLHSTWSIIYEHVRKGQRHNLIHIGRKDTIYTGLVSSHLSFSHI